MDENESFALGTEPILIEKDGDLYRALVVQASLPPPPEPPPPRERRRGLDAVAVALVSAFVVVAVMAAPNRADAPATRAPVAAAAAPANDDDIEVVQVESAPAAAVAIAPFSTPAPPKAKPAPSARSYVADASAAFRRGDRMRARELYQRALGLGGSDAAALAGLGDVARAEHATTEAITFYERAAKVLPTYLPARLGLADTLWDLGRRDVAVAEYRAIRSAFSEDVYPVRVFERSR